MNWLVEVIKKHFLRVIVYTVFSVAVVIVIALAFRDRINQKTTVQDGGKVYHYYENAKVTSMFGCQSLGAMKALKRNDGQ